MQVFARDAIGVPWRRIESDGKVAESNVEEILRALDESAHTKDVATHLDLGGDVEFHQDHSHDAESYPQIARIYMDMLTMYRASSQLIDESVQKEGPIATKMPKVRGLRTIKKEILKLITTYVTKADDLEMINNTLVPRLLESILLDYKSNVPDAREAEVLAVLS